MSLHPKMKTWNGFGVTCTRWHMWPCQPSAVTMRSTDRSASTRLCDWFPTTKRKPWKNGLRSVNMMAGSIRMTPSEPS
jgi:hypothetical protein